MITKTVTNVQEACEGVSDHMTLMLGGFGLCGIPENCIAELVRMNIKGLTCISNNAGVDDFGDAFSNQVVMHPFMLNKTYVAELLHELFFSGEVKNCMIN